MSEAALKSCTCRCAFPFYHDKVRIETEQSARFSFLSMTSFYLSVEDNKLSTETITKKKRFVVQLASDRRGTVRWKTKRNQHEMNVFYSEVFAPVFFFFVHGRSMYILPRICRFSKCLQLFSYRRRSANCWKMWKRRDESFVSNGFFSLLCDAQVRQLIRWKLQRHATQSIN